MTRVATWVLGLLVAALAVSWAWTSFAPRRAAPVVGKAHRVIRVQVLNGSGAGGFASRVAAALREGGMHVVEVENADRTDYFGTMVVARRADPEAARIVSRYLGGPPVIRQAWDSDLADVTLVIGRDRSQLKLGE
jgi:hypothetical protein